MTLRRRSKRRLALVAMVLLIGGAAYASLGWVRAAQQERLLAEARSAGLAAYASNDLDGALANLSYVFQHEKDDLEVNITFAKARARSPIPGGRHVLEAIELYSTHGLRLIDQQPALADQDSRREILHNLLDLYCQAGYRSEIIQTANHLLAIDPGHIGAIGAKAEALLMDLQYSAAAELVERLIDLEPGNMRWRHMLLDSQRELGLRPSARLEQCRRWAAEYNGDGRFHVLAASMLLEMNRVSEAREQMQHAVRSGATSSQVLEATVELLDLLDLRDLADDLVAATIERYPSRAWPRETAVRRRWHIGQLESALDLIESAEHELEQLSPALRRWRVVTLLSLRRADSAIIALDTFETHIAADATGDADRAWTAALRAALIADRVDWHTRMELIDKALSLQAHDAVLHVLKGDAWNEVGEAAQAIASYQRACSLDPAWLVAGVAHADALLRAGRFREAHAAAQLVITRAPRGHLQPLLLYAQCYLALARSGRGDDLALVDADVAADLAAVLQRLHRDNPQQPQVARILLDTLLHLGERESAERIMSDALSRSEPHPDLLLALADVALDQGHAMARPLLQRAREVGGLTLPIAMRLADLEAREGNAARGLAALEQVVEHCVGSPCEMAARLALVHVLLDHEPAAGRAALKQLIARASDDADVLRLAMTHPRAWDDDQLMSAAVEHLRQALGKDLAQVRLANANYLLRHHAHDEASLAKAIVEIEGVLARTPDSLAALTLLSEAVMRSRHPNIDRAVECLERAVNLYGDQPHLMPRLISLLQRRGDYAKAGRYLRMLASWPNEDAQLRAAELRLWRDQGDFETALSRAASLVNDSSPVHDQLVVAEMHLGAGKIERAQQMIERALAAHPEDPLVLWQAAEFYAGTGRFDEGLAQIKRFAAIEDPQSEDLILGAFHQRHGRHLEAGRHLQIAMARDPQSLAAHRELARHCLVMRDREKAREHAMAGLKIDPTDASLQAMLAMASLDLSEHERQQSIDALQGQRATFPELIETLEMLAHVPYRNSALAPTAANLTAARRLIDQHGNFMPAWQIAILLHMKANRIDEAIILARRAVGRFPLDPEPSQWATQLLMDARRWSDALAEALEWRRRVTGDTVGVDAIIASNLLQLDRAQEAVDRLQPHADSVWNQRERSPQRLGVWVRALARSGDFSRARETISPLLSVDAQWRGLWMDIAMSLDHIHAAEALSMIEHADLVAEELLALAVCWKQIGLKFNDEECFDRAERLATVAAESDNGSDSQHQLQCRLVQGGIAEARQDWDAAEERYRAALALDSHHPAALNNLAYVIAQTPQRAEEAMQYIERALGPNPDDPDFLDTRGQILLALDRAEEAKAALELALQFRPDDLGFAITLAEANLKLQRWDVLEQSMRALRQRFLLEKNSDPRLEHRFHTLLEQYQQTQAAAGT